MNNDDPINKIINAKLQFELKKANDELIKSGQSPITMDDFILHKREQDIVDQYNLLTNKANANYLAGEKSRRSLTSPEWVKFRDRLNFEDKLYNQKLDELLQQLPKESTEKANINPHFNTTDLDEYRKGKQFASFSDLINYEDEVPFLRLYLNKPNPSNEPYKEQALNNLNSLKNSNPYGKISIGYGDFRNPFEKIIDTTKNFAENNPILKTATAAPEFINKTLTRIAPPLAGADLIHKAFSNEKSKDWQPNKINKENAEIGLDLTTLGSPLARMAGSTGMAAGLDIAGMPLAGYLMGKEVNNLMGGEPPKYDENVNPSKYPASPFVVGPEQFTKEEDLKNPEAMKMYNYPAIKNLLNNR